MKAFPNLLSPLAITMWDFSWLERRWAGAGFEDWDRALDELLERGYNAVRIDAYPHLMAHDANKTWELLPQWSVQDWGSPARNRVKPHPALIEFISKCADRKIKVGLSTWFREDVDNVRLNIADGEALGRIWTRTIDYIHEAGLMDSILYVDLCNEWSLVDCWCPFCPLPVSGSWRNEISETWMKSAIAVVRSAYPQLPLTFSITDFDKEYQPGDLQYFDFFEPHLWMSQGEFYKKVGYNYERFSGNGYDNLTRHGEALYYSNPAYWQKKLKDRILYHAEISRESGLPLITTECWAVVDYKDWPLLDWGWVKELNAIGTETAASTGRWAAIATSNFCAPQFRGMWNDKAWHQRLTDIIRKSALNFNH